MDFKNKMIFTVLVYGIATLMLSASSYNIQQLTFISTFAQENEAEVEADIEQENKCKKDTECENENELNNELSIVNKTGTETGTGKLTVIKEVTCLQAGISGFTQAVFHDQSVITKIQYVPVGPISPCESYAEDLEPQDFEFTVTGNNPNPDTFPGSDSGVVVTLGAGSYDVEETDNVPDNLGPFTVSIDTTETGDCSGTISAGDSKTCTFTNDITLVFETEP